MEIQKITISEADRKLVSDFMGEEYPIEIDFNRLMPVWYKFRDLKFISPKLQFEHSKYKDSISRAICYQDIQVAFNEMVIAMKWHNQNQ